MDASKRRPPTTGLYCVQCGHAQERGDKGKPCMACGTLQFVVGLQYIDWAVLMTADDRDFLRSIKIESI
jgi:hypothetical protein